MNKIKINFFNPPHADWCSPNLLTYASMKQSYSLLGKFSNQYEWLIPPYKYDQYESIEVLANEFIESDIILFSSYIWNYQFCDELASFIKKKYPQKVLILGGPHIGTYEDDLIISRKKLYDFICLPTAPGEVFMNSFLDLFIEKSKCVDASEIIWELRSSLKKKFNFIQDSVYQDSFEMFKQSHDHALKNNLEPFIVLETTRGCPFKCVYCEWGGGTGTKVEEKDITTVKADIIALKSIGYNAAYLADANFGLNEDRDVEIYNYSYLNELALTDISTVKSKSVIRRKRLFDKIFNIVGNKNIKRYQHTDYGERKFDEKDFSPSLPTVSIQSISDLAMNIAKRVDLNFDSKLDLSFYIDKKCNNEGFAPPPLELIMGMPGSTLSDFYEEMEIIWNFKAWSSKRHDYMFLPDTELASENYAEKYKIKTINVYTDLVDEQGVDNMNSMYRDHRVIFKTIRECYSFTVDEMKEMFFMNIAGNILLRNLYPEFERNFSPSEFCKKSFDFVKTLDEFKSIWKEIGNIYDEKNPPQNIKKLNGKLRDTTISEFILDSRPLLYNELFMQTLKVDQSYDREPQSYIESANGRVDN